MKLPSRRPPLLGGHLPATTGNACLGQLEAMHGIAIAKYEGAREGSKKQEGQNPTLKIADWASHIERGIERLDVRAGVDRMCKVTGRFTAPPVACWKYKRSTQKVAKRVNLVTRCRASQAWSLEGCT